MIKKLGSSPRILSEEADDRTGDGRRRGFLDTSHGHTHMSTGLSFRDVITLYNRILTHLASMTTPTPFGDMVSSIATAICLVNLSCT